MSSKAIPGRRAWRYGYKPILTPAHANHQGNQSEIDEPSLILPQSAGISFSANQTFISPEKLNISVA